MVIGTVLISVQLGLSVLLLALFLGRDEKLRAIPGWLRRASASSVVWGTVITAGVIVSVALLLLRWFV